MKVEYMVIKVYTNDPREASANLTELAAQGWRVQSMIAMNAVLALILMWREVKG